LHALKESAPTVSACGLSAIAADMPSRNHFISLADRMTNVELRLDADITYR
jgi:hypothetical protein